MCQCRTTNMAFVNSNCLPNNLYLSYHTICCAVKNTNLCNDVIFVLEKKRNKTIIHYNQNSIEFIHRSIINISVCCTGIDTFSFRFGTETFPFLIIHETSPGSILSIFVLYNNLQKCKTKVTLNKTKNENNKNKKSKNMRPKCKFWF